MAPAIPPPPLPAPGAPLLRRRYLLVLGAVVLYIAALSTGAAASSLSWTGRAHTPLRARGWSAGLGGGGADRSPSAAAKAARPRRAYVTVATGDEAGRNALVMVQSLRDTGSAEEIIVLAFRGGLGSDACRGLDDGAWRAARPEYAGKFGRSCSALDATPEEVLSPPLLASFAVLGAEVRVLDPIPLTPYTNNMPGAAQGGGPSTFWSAAINKLLVFNLTEFSKVVAIDGDTLALANLDHLFDAPAFSASVTHSCCNAAAPGVLSGGLWVLEPSPALWAAALARMARGALVLDHGAPVLNATTGAPLYEHWKVGELNIVRDMVNDFVYNTTRDILWPAMEDYNHGYVPGLATFPDHALVSPEQLQKEVAYAYRQVPPAERRLWEGFSEAVWEKRGRVAAVPWRALPLEYDQCAASICDCLPERFAPWAYKSIHFSCGLVMNQWKKPGMYWTDTMFHEYAHNSSECTRYYAHMWLGTYRRAHVDGKLAGPAWAGKPLLEGINVTALLGRDRWRTAPRLDGSERRYWGPQAPPYVSSKGRG